MATSLPDIGGIPLANVDPNLRSTLIRMKALIEAIHAGTVAGGGGGGGSPAPGPTPVPGPPGQPGPPGEPGEPTPDLTPPPSPSGVIVTAGLDFVFIETDPPVFTQGHGYARTLVYGATYPGSGPLPTFGSAILVHEFVGQVGSFASEMGVQWHIWTKWLSQDGVLSASPEGGTNGHQVTTALLGNEHLGPLLVEAANLASGAVTAAKLAAGAVELTKFASGIEPVSLVAALPNPVGYTGAKTVFLTTTGKLYRYFGGAWVSTVPTGDLTGQITSTQITDGAITTPKLTAGAVTANELAANSVIAGKIAVGAVSAAQIVAGAITTDKLFVTGRGAALNDDPHFQDSSAWSLVAGTAAGSFVNIADGTAGLTAIQSGTPGATGTRYIGRRVALDAAKTYRVRDRARATNGGDGRHYMGAALFDSAGTNIVGDGAYWFYAANNVLLTASWSIFTGEFGANTARPFPAQARTMAPVVILNNASTTGQHQAQDLRIEEKASADLIVDGSITATKLAANAIAVGTAAIQNGAIVNAMIGTAAITNAKIADLAADKITAGSLAVGSHIQSSTYVAGSAGWRIGGDGTLELRNSTNQRILHMQASGSAPVLQIGSALSILASGAATFAGALSAATGTFAGALAAATGTFAGQLTAAGGSFASATGNVERITLNESSTNEARFYGDRGDGTIVRLASLGINVSGLDTVIGLFGTSASTRTAVKGLALNTTAVTGTSIGGVGVSGHSDDSDGVFGTSGTGIGVEGNSTNHYGVLGSTSSASAVGAVQGISLNPGGAHGVSGSAQRGTGAGVFGTTGIVDGTGPGVRGSAVTGFGGEFIGNATRGPLHLVAAAPGVFPSVRRGLHVVNNGSEDHLYFGDGANWLLLI